MSDLVVHVNGERRELDVDPETPLLWVLRDELGLRGTKYSCGIGLCGSCAVHVDGEPRRSCVTRIGAVADRHIATVEAVGDPILRGLRRAWIEDEVSQCGYCQPGMLLQAAALLAQNADPSDSEIDTWMRGNLCRCGTYSRIRRAIRHAAGGATHAG